MAILTAPPKASDRVRIDVGWPRALRRERVGLCLLTLSLAGVVRLNPEQLVERLQAEGFPQIAMCLREQLRAHAHDMNSIGAGRGEEVRRFAKEVIRKANANGK